jgi:hypothetical protein
MKANILQQILKELQGVRSELYKINHLMLVDLVDESDSLIHKITAQIERIDSKIGLKLRKGELDIVDDINEKKRLYGEIKAIQDKARKKMDILKDSK